MRRWVRNLLIVFLLLFPAVFISLTYLEDIAETNGQAGAEGIIQFVIGLPRRMIGLASGAGYLGVFLLMLLEAAAFPIPSEIILPFAGYLVSQGTLDFWPVVFYSTLASLIGSLIDYYLGLKLGGALLNSKLRFVNAAHLRRVQAWFNRYGTAAVALFRLVPAARVLISFPAGAYRMSKSKFAIYTLAGCLPWNFILIYLGWWLGSSWGTVVEAFRYINLVVYALLILLVVWICWKLTSRRSLQSR
jgi:membrane protein DedA with SNARE-associated domain